jgi:hypothetical protein
MSSFPRNWVFDWHNSRKAISKALKQETRNVIQTKKQAGLITGLLKKKNKNNLPSNAFLAQRAHSADAKRQQHQGTSHER